MISRVRDRHATLHIEWPDAEAKQFRYPGKEMPTAFDGQRVNTTEADGTLKLVVLLAVWSPSHV